jgi:hypothetical protein
MEGIPDDRCILGIKPRPFPIQFRTAYLFPAYFYLFHLLLLSTTTCFIYNLQCSSHHPSESSRFSFTFNIPPPTPFYLLFDFTSSSDEELFIFNFDDPQLLTHLYSQDTCSVTQDLLRIQMYQTNVLLAFDSATYRRSPQSRRPKLRSRNHFNNQDSFFPRIRHRCQPSFALCCHHQRQTQRFFNSDGKAWSS